MSDEENPKEGILDKLLSAGGDSTVKLITLALVVVSGGGNLLATHKAEQSTNKELDRAIAEIHQIHDAYMESVQRQKQMQQALEKLSTLNDRK
jgi:hypothetical protein